MAQQFLYLTGMPAIELRLLQRSGDAGLAKGLNDSLTPELDRRITEQPGEPDGWPADGTGFWHDNLAKLRQRFDTWQGH